MMKNTSSPVRLRETPYGIARRLEFIRSTIRHYFGDRLPSDVRIIDVGCGTGDLVSIPLAVDGYQVLGVDIHNPSIDKAREACDLPNARFKCCLLEDLEDESFDVLIASEVLEHLHRPEELLKELSRFTHKDSLLIITVPNGWGIREFEDRVFRMMEILGIRAVIRSILRLVRRRMVNQSDQAVRDTLNDDSGHVTFFTPWSLRRVIVESGYKPEVFRNKVILNGPFSIQVIQRSKFLLRVNSACADYVPSVVASSWMVAACRSGDDA